MMREAEVPVTFLPADRTVYVLEDTRLIEAAADAGIILDSPCGGEGICGKCRVQVKTSSQRTHESRKKYSFCPTKFAKDFAWHVRLSPYKDR